MEFLMKEKTRKHYRKCPLCHQYIEVYGKFHLLFVFHTTRQNLKRIPCPMGDGDAGPLKTRRETK
jgi:hypothetical protein